MNIICKCLNISLKIKEFVPFTSAALSDVEKDDDFFKKLDVDLAHAEKISKEHAFLVQHKYVGAWVTHTCFNCLTPVFASNRNKENSPIIVNKTLAPLSEKQIAMIKTSDEYSPVYNIIISDFGDEIDEAFVEDRKDFCKKASVALEKELEESIKAETENTEERIRAFTEEQYAVLQEYKIKARNEYESLVRILLSRSEKVKRAEQVKENSRLSIAAFSSGASYGSFRSSAAKHGESQPQDIPKIKMKRTVENSPKGGRSEKSPDVDELVYFNTIPASLDSVGLFPLEGMDDTVEQRDMSGEESDIDEEKENKKVDGEESMYIPRRGSNSVARSLPVKVPMMYDSFHWLDEIKTRRNCRMDEHECPEDIAASIKALANSVHGDTLLGDLPPPRIGSRI